MSDDLSSLVNSYIDKCLNNGPSADLEEKLFYADFRYHVLRSIPPLTSKKQIVTCPRQLQRLWQLLKLTTTHSLSDQAAQAAAFRSQSDHIPHTSCIKPPTSFLSACTTTFPGKRTSSDSGSGQTPAKHCSALSSAWLSFLSISLPSSILHSYLALLPRSLTAFSSPLRFADFLISLLSLHNDTSLLTIHPLFLLLRDHSLDHPSWFSDLLSLLSESLFTSPLAKPYLKALPLLLSATSVTEDVVKKFMVKLTNLSLFAPPNFSLWALSLVYELLTRHPVCVDLIHKGSGKGKSLLDSCVMGHKVTNCLLTSVDPEIADKYLSDPESESEVVEVIGGDEQLVEGSQEEDRKREEVMANEGQAEDQNEAQKEESDDEEDQNNDYLYELTILCKHYHPFISSLANSFKEVLELKKFNPNDFANSTIDDLIDEELKRKFRNLCVKVNSPNNFFPNSWFRQFKCPKDAVLPNKFAGNLPNSVLN
ncbi:hypothetical protein P9112_004463 [Eukaryota sp. TZLM1-RC]